MKKFLFGLFVLYYLSLFGAIWGGTRCAGVATAFGVLITFILLFSFCKLCFNEVEFNFLLVFNISNMLGILLTPFFFVIAVICSGFLLVFANAYIYKVKD